MVNNTVRLTPADVESRDCPSVPLSYTEIADSILDFMESQYHIIETGNLGAAVNWNRCELISDYLSQDAKDSIDDAVTITDDRKHEIVPIVSERQIRYDLTVLLRTLLRERA